MSANVQEVKKGCDCVAKANAALAEHNTRIVMETTINVESGQMAGILCIPTAKINRRGKPAMKLKCSYCPLCGAKQ